MIDGGSVYIKSSQAWWRWWWRSGREVTSPLYHLNPNPRRRPACTYTLIDWFVHIYIYEKSLQWHSVAFKGLTTNFNGIQRINSIYIILGVYIYSPASKYYLPNFFSLKFFSFSLHFFSLTNFLEIFLSENDKEIPKKEKKKRRSKNRL